MIPRRAGALAVAVAAGLLGAAAPAGADVSIDPPTAERGAGVNETFRVVNEHPTAAMTKIRLLLPAATPVAEVYPLSVPDWAPQIATRRVNPPMVSLHGGAPVSEATASITWTAAPGKALRPGKAATVMIAIGPLPQTEHMIFQIQATYADKSTTPAIAPVVLTLTPPAAAPAQAHGPAVGDLDAPEGAVAESRTAEGGSGFAAAGWIVAVVLAAAGTVALIRARRRSDEADGSDPTSGDPARSDPTPGDPVPDDPAQSSGTGPTDASGPVEGVPTNTRQATAHQARVTAWSYRDGP